MYIYANIILLEITIINLILLGVFLNYIMKFIKFLFGLKAKQDTKYLNKALLRFIEQENQRFYRT